MPGSGGGARPLQEGSVEAHNYRNQRTFTKKSKSGVTGRACDRCGIRGTKLTRTSVSSATWRMGDGEVNGMATMMTCPDCTSSRADIGAACRASMAKVEQKIQDEFREAHIKKSRGRSQ